MKRYISAILIPCLLMQIFGCYSYQPIQNEEDINLYSTEPVMFTLNNDQKITAKPEDCVLIKNHQLVIYGVGDLTAKNKNQLKTFQGQIFDETIDSLKNITVGSQEYMVCWLKDTTRISFVTGNYTVFSLNPDSSYWLIKNYDQPCQIINVNSIRDIQIKDINTEQSIIFGSIIIAAIVLLLIFVPIDLKENWSYL